MDSLTYKTISANKNTVDKKWVLVDASGQTLGRMCSKIAKLLRGKHKPSFTPHVDCGDNVIVVNADKIVLVNVGGDNLTTDEFKALSGVEISGNSFDNQTRILFDKDSSGGSGELAINGIYDSDLTTITLEILSDTNLSPATSGDLG